MAVSSNTVEVAINVIDETSAPVMAKTVQNIQQLGAAGAGFRTQLTGTTASFQGFGVSGTIAGRIVKQSMDEAGASVQETRERAHLFAEEFGVHLPRAFRAIIAESKLAQAALAGVAGALTGLGAIQIGFILFDALEAGVHKVWDFMTGLSKGTQEYLDQVEKTRTEDFGNTRSIEDTRFRIDAATQSIKDFRDQADAAKSAMPTWRSAIGPVIGQAWDYYHRKSESDEAADHGAALQGQRDKLNQVQEVAQFHAGRVGSIDIMHGEDAKLSKEEQITAQYQKRLDYAAEQTRQTRELDNIFGQPVDPKSGAETEGIEAAKAREEREVALFNLRKEQAEQLAHLREDALEAGLRGEDLYHAKMQFEIDDLARRQMSSPAAIDAIKAKYHAEQMRRIEDETRAVEKREREAGMSGLGGLAKTQAEGVNRLADIRDVDYGDVDKSGHSALADRDRATAQKQTNAQLADEQKAFAEQVDSIIAQSQSRQIGGFGRIRAEAEKVTADLQKQFDKAHELMDLTEPGAQTRLDQDTAKLGSGLDAITGGADRQSADLAARNADETSQIEAQARAKALNGEKQRTAAIEAEYEARFQKYEDWKRQELDAANLTANERASIEENASRREAAAWKERNAEMVEAAKQAREKMAGEFTSLFRSLDHPTEALKSLGEKAAGQAAAAMVQRMQMRASGSTLPAAQSGDIGAGNLWDKLMGRVAGQPVAHSTASAHGAAFGHAPDLASVKSITLSTAEIHIQSANLSFGGGASTAAGSPGAAGPISSTAGTGSVESVPEAGTYSASGHGGANGPSATTGPSAYVSEAGTIASGAAGPSGSSAIATGIGDVQKGLGLVKQARGIFGASGSANNGAGLIAESGTAGAGSPSQIAEEPMQLLNLPAKNVASNGGMLGGGGVGANLGGAVSGGMGLFSAYEGNGGISGTLSGAMSGMQLGMSVGGPVGAAIGAAGGAILGAIGFGGREKARVYDLKQVRPRIGNDMQAFDAGSMDYSSAYSDMQSLDVDARKTLDKMGGAARGYYWDTINGEIKKAEAKLTSEEKAGRSQVTMSAAQYDIGTDSVPHDGLAYVHENERITPSDQNERITRALEAGADRSVMPAHTGSTWGGDIHIHAIDAKSGMQWLMSNKHTIRAAFNESHAENSGGSDFA